MAREDFIEDREMAIEAFEQDGDGVNELRPGDFDDHIIYLFECNDGETMEIVIQLSDIAEYPQSHSYTYHTRSYGTSLNVDTALRLMSPCVGLPLVEMLSTLAAYLCEWLDEEEKEDMEEEEDAVMEDEEMNHEEMENKEAVDEEMREGQESEEGSEDEVQKEDGNKTEKIKGTLYDAMSADLYGISSDEENGEDEEEEKEEVEEGAMDEERMNIGQSAKRKADEEDMDAGSASNKRQKSTNSLPDAAITTEQGLDSFRAYWKSEIDRKKSKPPQ